MENIIIIPTYNEKNNIGQVVGKIFESVPDVSVLIVDDNSPDGTANEVRMLKNKFPNLELFLRTRKDGLGKAYIDAFEKILATKTPKKIITMDCDLSHDPAYLPAMLKISEKFDLVVGSRYIKDGRTEGWELWRKILSRYGNLYCKVVTGMPINDCTSGFNVINADLLKKIDFSNFDSSGYAFLVELKYTLIKNSRQITEFPIIFKNRIGGESKISNHIIGEGLLAPWKLIFKKIHTDFIKCRVCNSEKTDLFTRKNNFDLFKCLECGLIFVWPPPSGLETVYSSEYFSGANHGFGYTDYDSDKQAMGPTLNLYLEKLEDYLDGRHEALLDIGAATGFFLDLAKKRNWQRVAGVEISEWAAEKGRKNGLDIRTGTLNNADFKENAFDAVTLLDVIEHMPNPESELNFIRKILRKNGLILINTPDAGSVYAKVLGKHWHSLVPPEHIIYFNNRNLPLLLDKAGFKVIFNGKIPKKFALQYCFKIAANWLKIGFLDAISDKLRNSRLGQIAIPLDLKDNILIIAKKL